MTFPRVAVLGFHNITHWSSLRIIFDRWLAIYQKHTLCTRVNVDLPDHAIPESDYYVLLDHRWGTPAALKELGQRKAQVIVHVHGDLTIRVKEFNQVLQNLVGSKVSFVVASQAQQRLMTTLYPALAGSIQVCPYPVPADYRSTAGSTNYRTKLGLKSDDKLIGYAGRWSLQKGVMELVQAHRLLDDPKMHLALVGHFDDLGFAQLTNDWKDTTVSRLLPKQLGERIHLSPALPHQQMPDFLAALDAFSCTGCFHDEDFNLTASEALAVGTPTLLSAWGGHLDHQLREPHSVQLLVPQMTDTGFTVNTQQVTDALANLVLTKPQGAYPLQQQLPRRPQLELKKVVLENWAQVMTERTNFLQASDGTLNRALYQRIFSNYLKA